MTSGALSENGGTPRENSGATVILNFSDRNERMSVSGLKGMHGKHSRVTRNPPQSAELNDTPIPVRDSEFGRVSFAPRRNDTQGLITSRVTVAPSVFDR